MLLVLLLLWLLLLLLLLLKGRRVGELVHGLAQIELRQTSVLVVGGIIVVSAERLGGM